MKKNKKYTIIGIAFLGLILITSLIIFIVNGQNKNALTISEKKWLEDKNNTTKLIDVSINNDLPIFGNNGSGIFFNFIDYLQKETTLQFNLIPYLTTTGPTADYYFEVSNEIGKLNFYNDNYVILSKTHEVISNLNEINDEVGILNNELDYIKEVTKDNITLKEYEDIATMLDEFDNDTVKYIILPNITYMNTSILNNYKIVFNLTSLKESFNLVLEDGNSTLNSIITKYFNVFMETRFETEYKKTFMTTYYYNKQLSDASKANMLSKQYVYGYIENIPYDQMVSDNLVGINAGIINSFADTSEIEIVYTKYKNISALEKAINNNEVDIAYNYHGIESESATNSNINMAYNYVILSKRNSLITDLKDINTDVYTLEGTNLYDYLEANNLNVKTTNNINKLSNINDGVVIIDKNIYNYYHTTIFSRYIILYSGIADVDNTFILNNKNDTFNELFDYYIMSNNINKLGINGYNLLLESPKTLGFLRVITENIIAIIIVLLVMIFGVSFILSRTKKQKEIKKGDKLKFVDMLTSLKNRNYLNHNIKLWEENTIYPQTIIIVDLNNVKYINDNYGHEEGDSVIKTAANILINNQLENSDIIRTDGNEFLIYLVGTEEKDIISYIRKLYKELKDLPHGFGAAMGYSIINDEIKTIDDAINEATLDMRTNKERM